MRSKNSEPPSPTPAKPRVTEDANACVDAVIRTLGKTIVLALPLGLGKANHVANAFFARAQSDPQLSLHIITALTLEVPQAADTLGRRFLEPIVQRLYAGYPSLDYATARSQNRLPHNVRISEFFLNPGKLLANDQAQQHYMSSNYTHAVRDLVSAGVNVIAQMIAPHPQGEEPFSLSCNPDVTLELIHRLQETGAPFLTIGQVNSQLPFMHNDAVVEASLFDWIVHSPSTSISNFTLFNVPNTPVAITEYAIAAHVTSMIKDGGTLQLGIGSLADAIAHVLTVRQKNNSVYNDLLNASLTSSNAPLRQGLAVERNLFTKGLYAASEMLVEGLLQLREVGILTRNVYPDEILQCLLNSGAIDENVTPALIQELLAAERIQRHLSEDDVDFLQRFGIIDSTWRWHQGQLIAADGEALDCDLNNPINLQTLCEKALGDRLKQGVYCHSGFYLGSSALYQKLAALAGDDAFGINMCSVHFINALYGQETLKRAQRVDARFVNSALKATLMGEVIADGVAHHKVVSGVGGQYNFVAQAHELEGGRAIICLPSTRTHKGRVESNILWQYPHTTIPRHLRDIIVTEYGAADLRGISDREVIIKMLALCDSRFTQALLQDAKKAGKIEQSYELPESAKLNSPAKLAKRFTQAKVLPHLPYFPLGTDFTEQEAALTPALQMLKQNKGSIRKMLQLVLTGCTASKHQKERLHHLLARLQLDGNLSFSEQFLQYAVTGALLKLESRRPILAH